jgi:hypothetical protein
VGDVSGRDINSHLGSPARDCSAFHPADCLF